MTGIIADIRYAFRLHLSTPVSSTFATTSLAVAIACFSGFVSLAYDLFTRSHLGFDQTQSVATVIQTDGAQSIPLSLQLVRRIQQVGSIDVAVGIWTAPLSVEYAGQDQLVDVELVTSGYFSEMRPSLLAGRGFSERDHHRGSEPVAVLSYSFWQQRFGGRPALGELITVEGTSAYAAVNQDGAAARPSRHSISYRVVGVVSPLLSGTFGEKTAVWIPYEQAAPYFVGAGDLHHKVPALRTLVRVKSGVAMATARSALNSIYSNSAESQRLGSQFRLDIAAGVVPNVPVKRAAQRQVRLFIAASVLLALVAVTNISLFLLSRSQGRQRELRIRLALGAPLKRLVRLLIIEAGLLAFVATLLGVLISIGLTKLLQNLPLMQQIGWRSVSPLDLPILIVVTMFMFVVIALISLAPIVSLTHPKFTATKHQVTGRPGPGRQLAGTTQLALLGALAGAALGFVWDLLLISTMDQGFNAPDVHILTLDPPELAEAYSDDVKRMRLERERRRQAIAALPGVYRVAFATAVPGRVFPLLTRLRHPVTGDLLNVTMVSADSAYPDVLNMSLIQGRLLESTDYNGALVNESLARMLWGRTDVIGHTLEVPRVGTESVGAQIIGVVNDAAYNHPSAEPTPMVYMLLTSASPMDSILIQSKLSTAEVKAMLQQIIEQRILDVSIDSLASVGEIQEEILAVDRVRAFLTSISALLVIGLAAFGFYGTQDYLVKAGRREYAIRAALGAEPNALGHLVILRGFLLALPGLMLAIILSILVVTWLTKEFLTNPISPVFIGLVVGTSIGLLAILAALGPAREARTLCPGAVLREE